MSLVQGTIDIIMNQCSKRAQRLLCSHTARDEIHSPAASSKSISSRSLSSCSWMGLPPAALQSLWRRKKLTKPRLPFVRVTATLHLAHPHRIGPAQGQSGAGGGGSCRCLCPGQQPQPLHSLTGQGQLTSGVPMTRKRRDPGARALLSPARGHSDSITGRAPVLFLLIIGEKGKKLFPPHSLWTLLSPPPDVFPFPFFALRLYPHILLKFLQL